MSGKVRVTEHAIDRYIRRAKAVSRAEARSRILDSAKTIRLAAAFGAPAVRVGHVKYVIRGRTVVTVLDHNQFVSASGMEARQGGDVEQAPSEGRQAARTPTTYRGEEV
jgi:hypothetical protein